MLGLIFAGLSATFEATRDVISKKNLVGLDEYTVAWALRVLAFLFLVLSLSFIPVPEIAADRFWPALLVSGSLNSLTTVLYMKALRSSDLSLTVPILTFSPIFLLITSPLILGEFPKPLGLIGVFLIVAGSYMLNLRQYKQGYLAPFRALLSEKGPKLILLITILWAITGNFDKIGVQASSPLFFAIAINAFIAIALFPLFLMKSPGGLRQVKAHAFHLLPLGLFSALSLVALNVALGLTLVAYAVAIKRTSVVMGVLSGKFFFREKHTQERLPATIVMLAGSAFIVLSLV